MEKCQARDLLKRIPSLGDFSLMDSATMGDIIVEFFKKNPTDYFLSREAAFYTILDQFNISTFREDQAQEIKQKTIGEMQYELIKRLNVRSFKSDPLVVKMYDWLKQESIKRNCYIDEKYKCFEYSLGTKEFTMFYLR